MSIDSFEDNWEEDSGWEESSDNDWDDVELTTDIVLTKNKDEVEEKIFIIHEEIKCSNPKCSAIFFNGFICPDCNEINLSKFNKNLLKIKYKEAKKLILNLREIMEDSLRSIFNIEISMFTTPIKMNIDIKDVCQCCFMEFDDDSKRVIMKCHNNFCEDCVRRWISIKVRDNEVKPYIQCLSDKCHEPLSYDILNKYMDTSSKEKFIKYFSYKTLIKYQFFKQCKTYNCQEGVLFDPTSGREITDKTKCCNQCNETHDYSYKNEASTEAFKKLIEDNIIRLCPSCSAPTTKDRLSCNVITCSNCLIFWNWETRKTGATYNSVYKNNSDHWNKAAGSSDIDKNLYFEDKSYYGQEQVVNDAFI